MNIAIKVWAKEKYFPSKRHKKIRERYVEEKISVNIKEVKKEEFPVAFVVKDYMTIYSDAKDYNDFDKGEGEFCLFPEEIRAYNGKFYKSFRISDGAASSIHLEDASFIEKALSDRKPYFKEEEFSKDPIIIESDLEIRKEEIEKQSESYLLFEGKVWEECGEPYYYIQTFGLGNNRGGTGLFVDYGEYDVLRKNYFSSLEKEKAVSYAKNVAVSRGDTESSFDKRTIDVLMPELVKLLNKEKILLKKKKELEDIISHMYHIHDMNIRYHKKQINRITEICLKEIEKFPDIEINKFFITQMILEKF